MCKTLNKRLGLDCDGVLSDFATGIIERAKIEGVGHLFPSCANEVCTWNMCKNPKDFLDLFLRVQHEPEFWLSLPPLPDAQQFFQSHPLFKPEMYITKRVISSDVTREWLRRNSFPIDGVDVITVEQPEQKLALIKDRCDLYIDDLVATIRQVRAEGINGILYKAPYQRGEDISGLPVIESFEELCALEGEGVSNEN